MDEEDASSTPPDAGVDPQRRANDGLWALGGLVGAYANRTLRPVEVILLVRYRDALAGRILELGCGAGRLSGYLIEAARSFEGIDVGAPMIEYCSRRYPLGAFRVGDIREVGTLERGSFDAVVAPFNVIDVLGDAERGIVLDGIHHVLPPGAMFIMSTHNRGAAHRRDEALRLPLRSARRFVMTVIQGPKWLYNRRRMRPFEREEAGYAILNDSAHDFRALHYYISRDAQAAQLALHGFTLLECRDLDGEPVGAGDDAAHSAELHYVAIRAVDDTEGPHRRVVVG